MIVVIFMTLDNLVVIVVTFNINRNSDRSDIYDISDPSSNRSNI